MACFTTWSPHNPNVCTLFSRLVFNSCNLHAQERAGHDQRPLDMVAQGGRVCGQPGAQLPRELGGAARLAHMRKCNLLGPPEGPAHPTLTLSRSFPSCMHHALACPTFNESARRAPAWLPLSSTKIKPPPLRLVLLASASQNGLRGGCLAALPRFNCFLLLSRLPTPCVPLAAPSSLRAQTLCYNALHYLLFSAFGFVCRIRKCAANHRLYVIS